MCNQTVKNYQKLDYLMRLNHQKDKYIKHNYSISIDIRTFLFQENVNSQIIKSSNMMYFYVKKIIIIL